MTTVLIVEDDKKLAAAYARHIRRRAQVVIANTASEALAIIDEILLLGAILDYGLVDGNGLDVARHLRSRQPGAAVLIVTGRELDPIANRAACHGICVARKPVTVQVLTSVVHARPPAHTAGMERLWDYVRDKGLTRHQCRVLKVAFQAPSRELAAEELGISEQTLKSHISVILRKCDDAPSLGKLARQILSAE